MAEVKIDISLRSLSDEGIAKCLRNAVQSLEDTELAERLSALHELMTVAAERLEAR